MFFLRAFRFPPCQICENVRMSFWLQKRTSESNFDHRKVKHAFLSLSNTSSMNSHIWLGPYSETSEWIFHFRIFLLMSSGKKHQSPWHNLTHFFTISSNWLICKVGETVFFGFSSVLDVPSKYAWECHVSSNLLKVHILFHKFHTHKLSFTPHFLRQ